MLEKAEQFKLTLKTKAGNTTEFIEVSQNCFSIVIPRYPVSLLWGSSFGLGKTFDIARSFLTYLWTTPTWSCCLLAKLVKGVAPGWNMRPLQGRLPNAGASTVFATLWEVNDAATKELMVKFYQNLLEGKATSSLRWHKPGESCSCGARRG